MTDQRVLTFKNKRIALIIFILFIGTVFMKLFGLPPYYQTQSAKEQLLSLSDYGTASVTVDNKPLYLSYSGDPAKRAVLFIHGSPGSWDAWADYLLDEDFRKNAFMIAPDRAGFGGSDAGYHEPDLAQQAGIIMQGIEQKFPDIESFIIVGHSYGGPVALRLAVDYQDKVDALIMLAPSIDPEYEEMRWYNKLANTKLVRAIAPKAVDRSNQEILPLRGELLKMKPLLGGITKPVTVIQGEKDKLVPYQNAHYAKDQIVNADVTVHLLPKQGHFIPWKEYSLVKQTLTDYLEN